MPKSSCKQIIPTGMKYIALLKKDVLNEDEKGLIFSLQKAIGLRGEELDEIKRKVLFEKIKNIFFKPVPKEPRYKFSFICSNFQNHYMSSSSLNIINHFIYNYILPAIFCHNYHNQYMRSVCFVLTFRTII